MTELTAVEVMELFRNMIESDIKLFCIDPKVQRPENLLVEYVLAPPVGVRPTVKVGGDRTNEDDMTIKLYEILKQNNYVGHCMKDGHDMNKILENW